jgi:hypothetical protein
MNGERIFSHAFRILQNNDHYQCNSNAMGATPGEGRVLKSRLSRLRLLLLIAPGYSGHKNVI